jgi:hypothetical protein
MLRTAIWDIETWDLKPPFAPLLCASVLLLPEERMVTLRIDAYKRRRKAKDMTDDRQLLLDLRDLLDAQQMTVGYFSKGFDISMVQSRLALHGEEQMPQPKLHLDPIWYFKGWRGIKGMSAKMKHMADFFGLEQKPEVSADVWLRARGGNKAAMDEVCERCEADVRITRQLAMKALDLGLVRNIQRYP